MAAEQDRLTGPQLPQDFADLINCLNEAAVDYMLVLKNKRSTGRAKDAMDADELDAIRGAKS
jgi:hypothetical protein